MHQRLGSANVAAGFPQERQPKFPTGEIPLGQHSYKKCLKKERKEVFEILSCKTGAGYRTIVLELVNEAFALVTVFYFISFTYSSYSRIFFFNRLFLCIITT